MAEVVKEVMQFLDELQDSSLVKVVWKLLMVLLIYFIGQKVIKWFCRLLKKQMGRFGTDEAANGFVLSFAKIGSYIVLVLILAENLGIDKTSIVAVVGSAGVAISLALQDGLSNFVGGLIILFLRPFSVGDYIIESGGKNEGTVEKIELYHTTLTTVDSRKIVIPNSTLTTNSITNVTALDKRRLQINIGISYESDLRKAKEILWDLVKKDPQLQDDQEVQIYVDQLGESAVILGLRAWVRTEEFWPTKWRMNEEIKLAFDENGIQIPYPQMDVHVKSK